LQEHPRRAEYLRGAQKANSYQSLKIHVYYHNIEKVSHAAKIQDFGVLHGLNSFCADGFLFAPERL
jgi:hypothetical protein